MFFRKCPDGASFVIANGVKKCVKYLTQFHFTESDMEYLKSLNMFTDEYLDRLSKVKFTGDMWAVEDGTVVFPNEPVITIKSTLLEAQLVETALLLYFNRSSLITTKLVVLFVQQRVELLWNLELVEHKGLKQQ